MDLSRKEDRMPIARRMAQIRAEHGMTQQQCADALGIQQNTYSEMETGHTRFRRRDLVTLAVLYGVEPEEAFPAFFADTVEAA